jgi:hypothetical protein
METDDAYTIWCGPWRLCSTNRSHTTDNFPSPKLKLFPALPDSSMIHRLTNTSTQQFNDSLPIMCFHTDATSKEILHSHSQDMYILNNSSNSCHQQFTKRKKRVRSFPHVLSSLSLIPLVYFCNRSSTLHQTQREILSTAKLFSTELLTPSFCLTTVCR